MQFRLLFVVIFSVIAAAQAPPSIAFAPPAAAAPKPAAAAPAPIRWGGVTVTGSFRSRLEAWDWFEPSSGDNTYAFSGNTFRVAFSQTRESWDWTAELSVPFLLGLPSNAIGSGAQGALGMGANYFAANHRNRNAAMIFPKQLYVRFTQFGASRNHMLKLGRFEFLDGSEMVPRNATLTALKNMRVNQRLLGSFGFVHVMRSFDGLHYAYSRPWGNATFVGAVPTRGVFQTDGWGWNQAAFGYASFTRPWGGLRHAAETRLFSLFYDDWRTGLKTDNRPAAVRRGDIANIKVWTFGGHTLHALDTRAGTIDLMAWGAAQTGKWGVQDHRAYSFDVEAGIQPAILPGLKPWLRAGYHQGSGDGDPNDNRHETFFQVLPTPRPFARFPFFNMMNNTEVFGILILRPHGRVTVSSEFHALRLSHRSDLWYLGGGVFQPWSFGYIGRAASGARSLANLYDTNLEFRLNSRVTLTGYYGYAQGLAAMKVIYPAGKDGGFGYAEILYRF
jgi:hypothetical protein